MVWYQVSVQCADTQAGTVAERMEAEGALAVSFVDAADQPVLEPPPGEAVMWGNTRVQGLFEPDRVEPVTAVLTGILGARPDITHIGERDWVRDTQPSAPPREFGSGLWVVSQPALAPDTARATVVLEPGVAFGTGEHPTTELCLEWLADEPNIAGVVLDYGCGSGILGIAALKLGASAALLVDIDPQALESARNNAERNAVSEQIATAVPDSLGALLARHAPVSTMVANILLEPLVAGAPELLRVLTPGSRICLSGVLTQQVDALSAAYAPGLDHIRTHHRDGWAALSGTRRRA